jgi:CO/xanthine dehydrogenase FAD-binding subunit
MPADVFFPTSIEEAVALMEERGDDLVILAGGTVVMPLVHEGTLMPKAVIGLSRLGLQGITRDNGSVRIGSCTTLAQLAAFDGAPLLRDAAASIRGPALRTTATVGGNLFARAPYGDVTAALLAHDAIVELTGSDESTEQPLEDFLAHRRPGTVVTGLRVSAQPAPTLFLKLGRRRANATPIVTAAIRLGVDGPRIALCGAFERPRRSGAAEEAIAGADEGAGIGEDRIEAAAAAAAEEADPPTDAIASAWYRRRMVAVVVRRALQSLGDAK